MMSLTPISLSAEAFQPFGEVISTTDSAHVTINGGYANKHYNLARIDSQAMQGVTGLHIFVAKQRTFPLMIDMLEKHPHGSQAFIPRSQQPFLVVVAPPSEAPPAVEDVQAFVTNGNQGVNYAKGVWHFPLISLEAQAEFVVVDRIDAPTASDALANCEEYFFPDGGLSLAYGFNSTST